QNVYGMLLISAMYPGVKFIHIHRNPLNVVASLLDGKVMRPHTLKGSVNYWNEAMQIINKFKEAWPEQVFELSYEALTSNLETNIQKALSFLDEDPSRIELAPDMVHLEQNKYLTHIGKQDVEYIRQHCGLFMTQYGYS
ncbi:MAG: sulfotransferase family protein, partial [Methylococcales bacterium]